MSFLRWIVERALRGQAMRVDDLPEVRDVGRSESPNEVGDATVSVDQDLVDSTRKDLHEALQTHLRALYGPLVTTQFVVIAEDMLEDETIMLHPALSENITTWGLRGLSYQGLKLIHELTA